MFAVETGVMESSLSCVKNLCHTVDRQEAMADAVEMSF